MFTDDDSYDDDGSFRNYISKGTDPGPWMLIGVCLYSTFCILLVPILVFIGNRLKDRRLQLNTWKEDEDQDQDEEEDVETNSKSGNQEKRKDHPEGEEGIEVELDDSVDEKVSTRDIILPHTLKILSEPFCEILERKLSCRWERSFRFWKFIFLSFGPSFKKQTQRRTQIKTKNKVGIVSKGFGNRIKLSCLQAQD